MSRRELRREFKRKLKVLAVDTAMVFLALQITAVVKGEQQARAERRAETNAALVRMAAQETEEVPEIDEED